LDAYTPNTHERVVPGLGVAITSFWPRSALSNVDLPTLGRPTIAHRPARGASAVSSGFGMEAGV
jgi:hypothetical protein